MGGSVPHVSMPVWTSSGARGSLEVDEGVRGVFATRSRRTGPYSLIVPWVSIIGHCPAWYCRARAVR